MKFYREPLRVLIFLECCSLGRNVTVNNSHFVIQRIFKSFREKKRFLASKKGFYLEIYCCRFHQITIEGSKLFKSVALGSKTTFNHSLFVVQGFSRIPCINKGSNLCKKGSL